MIKRKLIHKCNLAFLLLATLGGLHHPVAYAQKTECAEVKIVIEQKLAFERQAFDAKMIISNGLSTAEIKNIGIELVFLDKDEQLVHATLDPNDTSAKFFYKTDSLTGIGSIEGTGQIPSKSSAEIHWLIIPSKNAVSNIDELYYVGAKVNYLLNDVPTTVEVTPDFITVRPLPELSLDYFLPKKVYGDDPLTIEKEPIEPFSLGVRVKNTGYGPAYNVSIDSAQPKIINNDKNLLVKYELLGSFVDDRVVDKNLNIDFGNIMPGSTRIGRWQMASSLSGEFVDFNAHYVHADELGGKTTSLIKEIKTHTLVHNVKAQSEDGVSGFLVEEDSELILYDLDGNDKRVIDISEHSKTDLSDNHLRILTGDLFYLKVKDPFKGQRQLVNVLSSTSNMLLSQDNFWLSKEQNDDQSWNYYINIFHNSYDTSYEAIFSEELMTSLISGYVFNDDNNNGLKDVDEFGADMVKVSLNGLSDSGVNIERSVYTEADGSFVFSDLDPGVYDIYANAINGLWDGESFIGNIEGVPQKGKIEQIKLLSGQHSSGNTFAKLGSDSLIKNIENIDLGVNILTPTIREALKVGQIFSIFLNIENHSDNLATNGVVELKVPASLKVENIQKDYQIDASGVIQLGDIPPHSNPLLIKVDLKVLQAGSIPLIAKVGSSHTNKNSKMKTNSILLMATPFK